MACFIKSENNSINGILNLLEFSHVRVWNCNGRFDLN